MQGSLALLAGVLYVGRHGTTAHVRPYDLDGRPLAGGFSFRGPEGQPSAIAGLDIDEDHQLWIADRLAGRVRVFTVFGREVASLGDPSGAGSAAREADYRGAWSGLDDVALVRPPDEDEAPSLLVARAGWRRHAVQRFTSDGHWLASLRPEGNPLGRFRDVLSVAQRGRYAYVCEGRPGRVQVFRDGEFHFAFEVPAQTGGRFEPTAVAPLEDRRLVIACAGRDSALLLVDEAGRLQRVLAEGGEGDAQVAAPNDVVVEEVEPGAEARMAVIDRDGERVQVFTLGGRCYGELDELPGQAL